MISKNDESSNVRPGIYVLSNANEELVLLKARSILAEIDMCQCEKCFLDVCAIALNELDSRYVTTFKGSILAQLPELSPAKELEMITVITRAAKFVMAHPKHDSPQNDLSF